MENTPIPFNRPPFVESAIGYMRQAAGNGKISGDGPFTALCAQWFTARYGTARALLTTSGSHALDMAAVLLGLRAGDEVIMPSYTFSSAANAFVGVGAKIVFIDIRPDTMNMDETLIEAAVTPRTKVLAPMHYAGVACEMDAINAIARKYQLKVVEDAAQGMLATYKGRRLGTLSDFGCFSFHETKNYSMGEGGLLLLRDSKMVEKAEIIREKGTNRSQFYRGQIDKYTWVDWGTSYLPSDLNAAYLWSQLEVAEEINRARLTAWNRYYEGLLPLAGNGFIELPAVPGHCGHNAHIFYIKTKNSETRAAVIEHLRRAEIGAVFHYVPLHSAPAGQKFGRFTGADRYTTTESNRLIRLPMFYGITAEQVERVVEAVARFYAR
jgi:dTDP-4-amino-4,6-dideoxygalactose transaminase